MIIKEPRHVASELRFALRKGVFVSIDELALSERGLACQCVCPKCNTALEACLGEVRQHYFRHCKDASDCGVTNESVLHAYAKQCLKDAVGTDKGFLIPRVEIGKVIPKTSSGEKSDLITIIAAELECRDSDTGIITDARITTSNGWGLNVEIKVSHGIDKAKAAKINSGKAFTMEITLDTHSSSSFKLQDVEKDIFGLGCKKIWNHPEAQFWQHNPMSVSKPRVDVAKPAFAPATRLPPRKPIIIPQNVNFEHADCYIGHNVAAGDNGLEVSLEYCNEHGEVVTLPVIKTYSKQYASAFEKLEPGSEIKVITHNGEVVRVLGC